MSAGGEAMSAYRGWDSVRCVSHRGRSAEAEESSVVYAHRKRTAKNPPMELMIAVMLHRMDDAEWTADELSPIRSIRVADVMPSYSPLGAVITFATGEEYEIDFADIDGHRSC
jgi:hypothetical protein